MMRLGITGTDTGVGKTVVASALLAMLRRRGLRVNGMKPVETGVSSMDRSRDASRLWLAAGGTADFQDVGPVALPDPLAPWLAARRSGQTISLTQLDRAFYRLSDDADVVVVEGAGGLLTPIAPDCTFDVLCHRWRLDLVIVAANRLGALNHVRLTLRAARVSVLPVRGVVLVDTSAARDLASETNAGALRELCPDLAVVSFSWIADPTNLDVLAKCAERSGLDRLLEFSASPTTASYPFSTA